MANFLKPLTLNLGRFMIHHQFSDSLLKNTVSKTHLISETNKSKKNYQITMPTPLQIINKQYVQPSIVNYLKIQTQQLKNEEIIQRENQNLLIRNIIDNRVDSVTYQANMPSQDRLVYSQLKQLNGYFLGVFDGHGGHQLSEFCKNNFVYHLQEILKQNGPKYPVKRQCIQISLKQAYNKIQEQFKNIVRKQIKNGNNKIKNVGTCAVCAIVCDNMVIVANSGDSKAIIVCNDNGKIGFSKLTNKLNTSSKKQRARLINQFPQQDDILKPHPKNRDILYVKGRLQPTRSLGDFYMKSEQFNFSPKIQNFKGPYINHIPNIISFNFSKQHKYLILGSDGLWDELSKLQASQLICMEQTTEIVNQSFLFQSLTESQLNNQNNSIQLLKKSKAQILLDNVLQKISKKYKMDWNQLKNLNPNLKRGYHDDISILVVDLTNQYEESFEYLMDNNHNTIKQQFQQ